MGGGACQSIIIEGNVGYGVVETFAIANPKVNAEHLLAAIQASCQATVHASLYFIVEEEYDKFSPAYTQPIIDIHSEIVEQLPVIKGSIQHKQNFVDRLTDDLLSATRKTKELFE